MDTFFGLLELACSIWAFTQPKPRAGSPTPREPDRWTPPEQWEINQVIARGSGGSGSGSVGGPTLPPDRGDPLYDRDVDG